MALAFDSHGAGPPLVLLHGIGSRRGVWDPVVGALARERRVIAVDLPGFAESPQEDFEPTPAGFTAYLERWFAEQGLDRPHVAGNSMGGAIALELARRGAVASATGISPAGFWNARETGLRAALAARLARHRAAAAPRGARPLAHGRRARRALLADLRAAVAAVTRRCGGDHRRLPRLLRPSTPRWTAFGPYRFGAGDELRGVPVTIAWGTRDALLIPRQARRARRLLPSARHVTLQGCGHVPFHDDPETVAAVLLAGSAEAG